MARNVVTQVDSADFFVQARDSASFLLNVTATATGTNTSGKQTNTLHKGCVLYVGLVTVFATCTLGINVLGIDAASGNPFLVARASIDGIQGVGAGDSNLGITIYPGATQSNPVAPASGVAAAPGACNAALPAVFEIQASLTCIASGGSPSTSYQIGMSKIL